MCFNKNIEKKMWKYVQFSHFRALIEFHEISKFFPISKKKKKKKEKKRKKEKRKQEKLTIISYLEDKS